MEYLSAIHSPEEAADVIKPMLEDCDREKFIVLLLDTKNHVVAANTVSIGTVNASLVHPREIFKVALLCNASAVLSEKRRNTPCFSYGDIRRNPLN